ncbi:MAG: FAD-dependent thymidylate synthase, partial [Thermoplasmatota archaeon]
SPQLQFASATSSALESSGAAQVQVIRTGSAESPDAVDFATSDGTALAGRDYTSTSGTLVFGVGERLKSISVPLFNNDARDGDRILLHGSRASRLMQALAGGADAWRSVMDGAAELHDAVAGAGVPEVASYAVSMAYRVRFYMEMNAREAMHLIELRSSPQEHPSYRRVAQEMYQLIRDVAGHAQLEFPIGTVLFSTPGWITNARVSPDAKSVAFIYHPVR